jgi:hypothetical protein
MKFEKTVFGGRSFKYPEDFVRAFRPTKWSIRKYIRFVLKMDSDERYSIVYYTEKILSISYTDRNTINFIKQIKEKSPSDFGLCPEWEFKHPGIVTIKKGSTNKFIATMTGMMKTGIIQCSGVQLAEEQALFPGRGCSLPPHGSSHIAFTPVQSRWH